MHFCLHLMQYGCVITKQLYIWIERAKQLCVTTLEYDIFIDHRINLCFCIFKPFEVCHCHSRFDSAYRSLDMLS